MIERLLIVLVVFGVGVLLMRIFATRRVKQAQTTALTDPILSGRRTGIPTVVYFTMPTCVPCQTQQQPALLRLQNELGENIQIIKIDAAQDPDAANRWGVFSAPTTFILDKIGQPRQVNYGVADTIKLKRQIEAVNIS